MKIYLDNCSFNRPFDDQSSIRIKLETEAKLFVQEKILIGELQLIWSHILEYENIQNPFIERRNAIVDKASEFTRNGVKSKDALHIACAIEGKAEYFLTTDDKLLKKMAKTKELIVINPVNFISILESMR